MEFPNKFFFYASFAITIFLLYVDLINDTIQLIKFYRNEQIILLILTIIILIIQPTFLFLWHFSKDFKYGKKFKIFLLSLVKSILHVDFWTLYVYSFVKH